MSESVNQMMRGQPSAQAQEGESPDLSRFDLEDLVSNLSEAMSIAQEALKHVQDVSDEISRRVDVAKRQKGGQQSA